MKTNPISVSNREELPERTLFWLSVGFIAFALIQNMLFHYGRDQDIYALVARSMLDGGAPYKDAWDFKPPGIYFIYALSRWVFGNSMHAIRLLESLGLLSLVLGFVLFSRRHLGSTRVGALGGALALMVHVQFDWWHTAQPESFGAIFLVWAVFLSTYKPDVRGKRHRVKQAAAWLAAGMLYTFAALLKPPLGGGFVVSMCVIAYLQWKSSNTGARITNVLSVIAFFSVGALLVLLVFLAYFAAKGALPDLYAALFEFAPHYTSTTSSQSPFPVRLIEACKDWWVVYSVVGTLGLFLVFILPKASRRENEGLWHIAGILVLQLIGVALQAKFFKYHFGAIFPFTALLAGWGYWKLLGKTRWRWAIPISIVLLSTVQMHSNQVFSRSVKRFQALFDASERNRINGELYKGRTYNSSDNHETALWLASNTPKNEPIYVWGFLPGIYDMAERPFASKYIYNAPQRIPWAGGEARRVLIRELEQSSPSAIVVASFDSFKWVTGNERDSAQELEKFPRLSRFISEGYTRSRQFGKLHVFLRNDLINQ